MQILTLYISIFNCNFPFAETLGGVDTVVKIPPHLLR